MNVHLILKTIINFTLILITIIIGIILHKTGRPYNNFILAIHKLTTVVFVVLIIMMIITYKRNNELNAFIIILIALVTISILGLIVSGGALSLNKNHELMLTIHRISSFLFLSASSGVFYTFFQIKF